MRALSLPLSRASVRMSVFFTIFALFPAAGLLAQTMCTQIMVDQFGYRQYAKKVVTFADPQAGQNNGSTRTRVPARGSM